MAKEKHRGKEEVGGKDEVDDNPPWTCSACTLVNPAKDLKCSACGFQGPYTEAVLIPADHWQCPSCTCSNPNASDKCSVCGGARGGGGQAGGPNSPNARNPSGPPSNGLKLVRQDSSVEACLADHRWLPPAIQLAAPRMVDKQWKLVDSTPDLGGEFLLPIRKAIIAVGVERAQRAQALWRRVIALTQEEERLRKSTRCLQCGVTGFDRALKVDEKCNHPYCVPCLKQYLTNAVATENSRKGVKCPSPKCNTDFDSTWIKQLLPREQYERYLKSLLDDLLTSKGTALVKCPAPQCGAVVELVQTKDLVVPKPITEMDDSGKVLTKEAYLHYKTWRVRCRDCGVIFCGKCNANPYHLGFDCEKWKEYGAAQHCRYCAAQLTKENTDKKPPALTLSDICTAEECLGKRANACTSRLPCEHPCLGIKDEAKHPPCLRDDCPTRAENLKALGYEINHEELCNICWTEELGCGPSIQLECGHLFHFSCAYNKLKTGFPGSRLTFGFMNCAICKKEMSHPSLEEVKKPFKALLNAVVEKNEQRMRIENLMNDPKLTDPNSRYYGNPRQFALDSFAYYKCFKCQKAYFGGRRDCEQNADSENRPPNEFICFDCAELPSIKCQDASHKEWHVWKCRFCCNTAVWFCFGTTHYCEPCHKDNPMEKTKRPRSGFKQCPGKEKCPIRTEHAPNGCEPDCEFSLGCGMCLDDHRAKHGNQVAIDKEPSKDGGKAPVNGVKSPGKRPSTPAKPGSLMSLWQKK